MKCIRCQHDSRYPARPNRTCPNCKGKFAFEPQTGDPVTDGLFQKAIEAVSATGGVRYGIENLYYEICRRKRSKIPPSWVGVFLLLLAGVLVGLGVAQPTVGALWAAAPMAGIGGIVVLVKRPSAGYVTITPDQFRGLWDRWCNVHGTPDRVILRRDKPSQQPEAEPDLGDYSFDRAVICDRARTVDLLLANNFHFENNCAILSIDGYPPGPFQMVKAMLQKNPKLQVFVLHDASPDGCRLARKLARDREWFPGSVRIIDVGLRPGHAKQFFGVWQQAGKPIPSGDGISASEAAWLSESRLELAAVRPQQVIRWLFRAINSQAALDAEVAADTDGGDGVFYYSGSDSHVLIKDTQAIEADFDSFG